MSLRLRMIFAALIPVTLVALVLTATFAYRHLNDMEQALEARGLALARQTAVAAEFGLFVGNEEQLQAMASAVLRSDEGVTGVGVLNRWKILVAGAGPLDAANWPSVDEKTVLRQLGKQLIVMVPVIQHTLAVDDAYSGTDFAVSTQSPVLLGHAVVELSLNELREREKDLLIFAAIVALLGSLVGGAIALRISRTVTRPLLEATEVVERLGRGDVVARASERRAGPLLSLAQGINVMAERIGMTQEDLRRQVDGATAELVRQRDAAQKATAAKSRFLAAASHDLRQPLMALGLFVSHLRNPSLGDQREDLVNRIQDSVGSLQTLFDTLLDLSRLETVGYRVDLRPFDLMPFLQKHCDDVRPLAAEKHLELRLRGRSCVVRSDSVLVGRLLQNLLHNAMRYTEKGAVLLASRRVGDRVRIQVWDTGIGIPVELQADIFGEYVQIGNRERNQKNGLGLGLSICQRIASLLETEIGVRSVPKRGSVFWFDLPLDGLEDEPNKDEPEGEAADVSPAIADVLVISNGTDSGAMLADSINRWEMRARVAEHPDAALEMLQALDREAVDCRVAVCDTPTSAEAQTIAAAEHLQQLRPVMRIILIADELSPPLAARARHAGFLVLKKPVAPARLRASLLSLLEASVPPQ
jgi:signal transduction histidine kinase